MKHGMPTTELYGMPKSAFEVEYLNRATIYE
jgi:hypothetical protein